VIVTAKIERESAMIDILYIAIAIVFFAVAASFTRGCNGLLKEE